MSLFRRSLNDLRLYSQPVEVATPVVHYLLWEKTMDWSRIEGEWKHFRGRVKEKWGRLTDDDLKVINGRRDRLEGKIHQRYGYAEEHVRKEVEDWFRWQNERRRIPVPLALSKVRDTRR
jgi:uncharacterized protein YjbJ (UPF0337 family)